MCIRGAAEVAGVYLPTGIGRHGRIFYLGTNAPTLLVPSLSRWVNVRYFVIKQLHLSDSMSM
jgi:hypothetical protein